MAVLIVEMNKLVRKGIEVIMKRLEKIFITNILLAILICTMPINEAKADDVLYVSSYSEDDMQMMREYSAKSVMYLTLTDIDTNELIADAIVSILYDYADGYWVEMNNVYLSIECYEGYLVFVDENQEIYQDYGVRYCTISNSDGLNIKYKIKAYADCYGETSVDYEIIDRYYD